MSNPTAHPAGPTSPGLCRLLVLALLLALLLPGPVAAAAPAPAAVPPPAGFFNDILGNRTRMIQVGVLFVVVGTIFLMRSSK